MQIILDNEDVLKILHTCFSDGGLYLLNGCGISLDWAEEDYKAARAALTDPCLEDVWIQMLRENRRLYVVDSENENAETDLTIAKALENFKNPKAAEDIILLLGDGDYDAIPCYRLIQYALYGDVVYG